MKEIERKKRSSKSRLRLCYDEMYIYKDILEQIFPVKECIDNNSEDRFSFH